MKYRHYASGALLALLAVACGTHHAQHNESAEHHDEGHKNEIYLSDESIKEIGIESEEVAAAPFSSSLRVSGQILLPPGSQIMLTARTSGIVSFGNSYPTSGNRVSKGEVVAHITTDQLTEGDLFTKTKTAYLVAKNDYNRAKELIKDHIISQREYEAAQMTYQNAKTAYEAQAPHVSGHGLHICAPEAGYLGEIVVKEGDFVSMGQPIGSIVKSRRLMLRADVPEEYYRQLQGVTTASFATAGGDELFHIDRMNGRLLSYSRNIEPGEMYLPVYFEFDGRDEVLPGTYADVYLTGKEKKEAISVPNSALTEEQGLYFVYIDEGNNHFRKQEVVPGSDNGVRTEIKSGLKTGERVVYKGAFQLKLASTTAVAPIGHSH